LGTNLGGTCNWWSASSAETWGSAGGSYINSYSASQQFLTASGDLSIDVTELIGYITASTHSNYGFLLKLRDETGEDTRNPKYFYGRDTNTIFEPTLYAKWNDYTASGSATASTI